MTLQAKMNHKNRTQPKKQTNNIFVCFFARQKTKKHLSYNRYLAMKKNIFLSTILFPLKCLEFILFSIIFFVAFILLQPFVWCKTKGKKNLNKNDEARVFVSNHYEIYGPFIIFMRFPYRFKPWIIDKMVDAKQIEEQMSIGLYNNYKLIPKWIKFLIVKLLKRLLLFILKFIRPIAVSRDNPRTNLDAMKKSVKTLEKGCPIFLWPELHSVKEGVGEFMSGFEHLGKYYYQKTGKKISFYPVFTSRKLRTIFIEKPIIYNPDNDANDEKQRIVLSLRESMIKSYEINELSRVKKSVK